MVYFAPTKVEEIADAIVRIESDGPLREELKEAGITRASFFSWRRAAQETLEVFASIMREER